MFAFFFIVLGFFMLFRGLFVNGIWTMMIGWFLYSAAGQGYHQVIMREMLAHVRAEDLMDRHVQSISGNLTIQKLVDEFIFRHQDRTFIVADRGEIEGIISLEDVKKIPRDRWPTTRVSEAMTPREDLSTASPDDDGNKVLAELTNKRVHQVPVVKDGKIEGIISRTDILHFLQLRSDLGV
jgi:CBS-domain-containing membrane protein